MYTEDIDAVMKRLTDEQVEEWHARLKPVKQFGGYFRARRAKPS